MGNSENLSSSRERSLTIQLEQSAVYPGSILRGELLATLASPLDVTELYFVIDGKQASEWVQPQGPITRANEVCDSFIKLHFPMQIEKQWPAGVIRVPFSLRLPLGLTPTFIAQSFTGSCHVFYTLNAHLCHAGKNPLVCQTPIRIESQAVSPFSYPSVICDTRSVYAWCCFPRGSSSLSCTFTKKVFKPGEEVPLCVELDNTHCSLDVSHISIDLIQKVKMKTLAGFRQICFQVVESVSLPGPAQRSRLSLNRATLLIPQCFSQGYPMKRHKAYQNIFVQPSLETESVICEYYVEVKAYFKRSGFGSPLKLLYPISIHHRITSSQEEECMSSNESTQASEHAEKEQVASGLARSSFMPEIFTD